MCKSLYELQKKIARLEHQNGELRDEVARLTDRLFDAVELARLLKRLAEVRE